MNLLEKLRSLPKPQTQVIDAGELEPNLELIISGLTGGELCFWREKTMEATGELAKASATEKLLFGISLSLVDKDGNKIMKPDDYGELNKLPLPVLDRLIAAYLSLNNLGISGGSSADENDLKNSSEATPGA